MTIENDKLKKARLININKAHAALRINAADPYKQRDGENSKLENALVGDLDPRNLTRQETPAHRTMVNMTAAGYTIREISIFTGYNETTVATAIKQPAARKYLINEAKKTVQDEIKALLEQQALPSIKKLISVRDSDTAKNADVLAASNALLDRFLGKPIQPVTTELKPVSERSDKELREEIERELAATQPN